MAAIGFVEENVNPDKKRVGDCVIRAISKALGQEWEKTYIEICLRGLDKYDMPSANYVWGDYLKSKGFRRELVKDDCPECYTVKDFCRDFPHGTYILALSGHVVAAINGSYYDTWDSGDQTPIYYWYKGG